MLQNSIMFWGIGSCNRAYVFVPALRSKKIEGTIFRSIYISFTQTLQIPQDNDIQDNDISSKLVNKNTFFDGTWI